LRRKKDSSKSKPLNKRIRLKSNNRTMLRVKRIKTKSKSKRKVEKVAEKVGSHWRGSKQRRRETRRRSEIELYTIHLLIKCIL